MLRGMPEFSSPAEHYDRFMGRYTEPLARALVDATGIEAGMRVVDVGCGPGGLTTELAGRLGGENVAAIDPAAQFVAACRERVPGADVREGVAEQLPWEDASFDAALSCLVLAFMSDADAGLTEMARVTKPGGTVAACMWDLEGGGMRMLALFWKAMKSVKPDSKDERDRAGTKQGEIAERMRRVGLAEVTDGALEVEVSYTGFEDFWEPFTHGVGPAGQALASFSDEQRDAVGDAVRADLPEGPFTLPAVAWFATGTVSA